jgi:hypothetical protein
MYGRTVAVSCVVNLSTRQKCVVAFMPWLLFTAEEKTLYSLDRRMHWPHSHSEQCVQKKNPALLGIEPRTSILQISLYTD